MSKLLHEVTVTVDVPFARAAHAAAQALPAARPGLTVEKDLVKGFFSIQGGWWYRGEYQLAEVPGGTRITHRVLNVAQRGRWAVPLANKMFIGFKEQTDEGFRAFAAHISSAA
jgi:hypothetical protein